MPKLKTRLRRLFGSGSAQQGTAIMPARDSETASSSSPQVWENFITLNSDKEPDFGILGPARDYHDGDLRKSEWNHLDYTDALNRDTYPLPATKDREGYFGEHHFSYWASGLADARHLTETATQHNVQIRSYLDLGCASGRVLRHMPQELPGCVAMGCDINRQHVEWCNAYLPRGCIVFQNHSIPTLPLEDSSIDLVSAFSVFTHIEALETAWLMEIRRILRPGGLTWITVHTEKTLEDMDERWPLWKPTMTHPDSARLLDAQRHFEGNRVVLRWQADRSYSSNTFYKTEYLQSAWSRIMDIVQIRRRFPLFQDVIVMRKPS